MVVWPLKNILSDSRKYGDLIVVVTSENKSSGEFTELVGNYFSNTSKSIVFYIFESLLWAFLA